MGKEELGNFEIAGKDLHGYISTESNVKIGDRISCSLKQKGVFIFDAETGERLA